MLLKRKKLNRLNNTHFKSRRCFSIRKLSVGTVSIMVGISFMFTGGRTVSSTTQYSGDNLSNIINTNNRKTQDNLNQDINLKTNNSDLPNISKKNNIYFVDTKRAKKSRNKVNNVFINNTRAVYTKRANLNNRYVIIVKKTTVTKKKKTHKKIHKKKQVRVFNIDKSAASIMPVSVAQEVYYSAAATDNKDEGCVIKSNYSKRFLSYSPKPQDENITETGKIKNKNHVEYNLDKYQSKNNDEIVIPNYVIKVPYVCYRLNFDQNIYNFSANNLSINFKNHSMPKKAIAQVDYAHNVHPVRKVPNNLVVVKNKTKQSAEYISQVTTVVYYDEDLQRVIKVKNLTNNSDRNEKYNTQAEIIKLFQKHYILVSDPTLGKNILITKQPKLYKVKFRHQTVKIDAQQPYGLITKKNTTRRIHYLDENNNQIAPSVNQTVTFLGTGFLDLVTGNLVNLNSNGRIQNQNGKLTWHTNALNGKVPKVVSPVFYDKKVVEILPRTVATGKDISSAVLKMDDNDQTIIVKYIKV